jgi:type III secretion system FlhB-like substrate exporter
MARYLNLVVSVPVLFDEGPEAPSVVAFGSGIVTQSRVMEPAPKVRKYGNRIGQ